jgi:hypothetical protein
MTDISVLKELERIRKVLENIAEQLSQSNSLKKGNL